MLQKKYKVIAIVGKSGSGKDYYLRKIINERNYHEIVSSTTRPPREGEQEGINYHFLTDTEFAAGGFMEQTSFNGWHYGTRYSDLNPDKQNIGVFNPAGVRALAANENIDLEIIYIEATDKTRLLRQLNREEEPNVSEIIRRFSTDEKDFQNWTTGIPKSIPFVTLWNDDRVKGQKQIIYCL